MALYTAASTIHGNGLYSDKVLIKGHPAALVFVRINNTGIFTSDWRETFYGRHTNHSNNPSTTIIVREKDIVLQPLINILAGEELTADYHQLIKLFNSDITLIRLINFAGLAYP